MDYEQEYDRAVKEERTEVVRAQYLTLDEEGDKITGRFVGIGKVVSSLNDKEYNQYLFDTSDGLVKFPLSSTVDVEAERIFKEGEIYRIEFLGKTKTQKGYTVKDFDIRHVIEPRDMPPKQREENGAGEGKK